MTNPLVAQAQSSTTWYTGLGLVEDVAQVSNGIQNNSWVDGTLGTVGGALDILGMAIDPIGSLVSWGVSWLMEHLKPLKDALDWLAGNPDEIAAHAQTWDNVAKFVDEARQQFRDAVAAQTGPWVGDSGDAYREHAGIHLSALEGIQKGAHGISYAVQGAGLLVGLVRGIVRDLIAQFIGTLAARLPMWLAEEGLTLGLGTPVVVGQVATLVTTWVNKIQKFVRALLNSLKRLRPMVHKLGELMTELKELLKKLGRSNPLRRGDEPELPGGTHPPGGDIPGARTGPAGGNLYPRGLDPHYLGETDPATASRLFNRPSNGVWYARTAAEREQFRLYVDSEGKLRSAADGTLFDTADGTSAHSARPRAVYVMDENGNLYASNYHQVGAFHHSSFTGGQPVASAGEITVKEGVVTQMNNGSGHYKPTPSHYYQGRDELLAQGLKPGANMEEDLWWGP
ncbi:WXG100 family type VII secretion target [Hamadaea tsunoensis]|uniref:WXG100 family type VII secretion target n=1 Tax=Hamadaea tsunoensis TaxID=53368 RepID=UPI000419C858|nr:hypothetical protein [Hamadaea tsunoensis]